MTLRQIVTNRYFAAACGVAVVVAAGLGYGRATTGPVEPDHAPTTVIPVEAVTAEAVSSFYQRRTFTGVLKAARTSELGFERTGRLVAIAVDQGDRVQVGQVLARLDTANLQAKQRELDAQRGAAQSLLEQYEAGPREQTIAAARAEVADLEAQAELAQLNFRRRQELLDRRAISQQDYDETALGLRSTGAKLDAARHRLDELEAGTRVEQLEAQRAVVAQLDAALANVAVDLEESTLRAPFSGAISKRFSDEGVIVAPGAPLLRLVEDEQLEAWIGLPAEVAARLLPGDEFDLTVGGARHAALLRAVLPELDAATRTRTSVFRLSAGTKAAPAQVVRITLDDQKSAEGVWAPTAALTRGGRGLWSVLVAQPVDGRDGFVAAKRSVEVLHTDGPRALIRGTIRPGEAIIVSGPHRVASGQAVAIAGRERAELPVRAARGRQQGDGRTEKGA